MRDAVPDELLDDGLTGLKIVGPPAVHTSIPCPTSSLSSTCTIAGPAPCSRIAVCRHIRGVGASPNSASRLPSRSLYETFGVGVRDKMKNPRGCSPRG
jgi:hypothetical protein